MIVECDSCHSRYNLKSSIMKGFQGAKVRCRKCGGTFIIQWSRMRSGPGSPVDAARPAIRVGNPSPPPESGQPVPGKKGMLPKRIRKGTPLVQGSHFHRQEIRTEAPTERIPEKVDSLSSHPAAPTGKIQAEDFDISGSIRPEPPAGLSEQGSAALDSPPVEESPKSAPDLLNKTATDLSGITYVPERFSNPPSARVSHVALVYLALLILGGCGYLIVNLLSGYLKGGG